MSHAISVTSPGGPLCTVLAHSTWTVATVKEAVEGIVGIPENEQRLLSGCSELVDAERIAGIAELTLIRWTPRQLQWLARVENGGRALARAPPWVTGDRGIVLAAVRRNGPMLQFAAPELRADREIVLAAAGQHGPALQYAAEELLADRSFALAVAQQEAFNVQFLPEAMKADREVILSAVRRSGCVLQYVAPELRADREIVLAAVGQHGAALKHAAEELLTDRSFALAVVQREAFNVQFLPEAMKAEREVILSAVRQNGRSLQYASPELRADREIILAAAAVDVNSPLSKAGLRANLGGAYHRQMMSENIDAVLGTAGLILPAARQNGQKHAASEVRAGREMVFARSEQHGPALQLAAEDVSSFLLMARRERHMQPTRLRSHMRFRYYKHRLWKGCDIVLATSGLIRLAARMDAAPGLRSPIIP